MNNAPTEHVLHENQNESVYIFYRCSLMISEINSVLYVFGKLG